jgi:hypothetical protein
MQDGEFDRVALLSASIPKSFYLIQSGSNTFVLKENATQVTITVPQGNYNRNSLMTVVKTLLNANSPNGWTYSITYPNINVTADNGYYYFTVTGNSSQPSFIFGSYLYEQLGFNANTTYQFSSNSLVSINVCNLSIETTLFIHSDMSQNMNSDNTLQEIYSNGESSYSYINYINVAPHEYSKPLINNTSNVFRFYITDENGNMINTNGINVNFTIMVYKTNPLDSMLTGFIKLMTLMMSNNNSSINMIENDEI